jgi:hypothetical protein
MSADAKVAEIRRDPPAVTSVIRHTVKAGPESRRGIRMAHDESQSNTLDRIPRPSISLLRLPCRNGCTAEALRST